MNFGKDFLFGAATASYQIEGGQKDGIGVSTWDVFAKRPGKVLNNEDGKVACNHYELYKDDVKMMKEMGLKAYRFSISWPRVMPTGEGQVNELGLAFYDNLIDELLKNGIEPWITLFHWDLPQALQDKYGGWQSKEVSRLFAKYTEIVVKRYSDRVKNWFTINEIMCFTTFAHRDRCFHAPGIALAEKGVNQTIHNALLGHGLAVRAIREHSKQPANIGLVENLATYWPVIDTEENIQAAREAWLDGNDAILLPALTGKYRKEYLDLLGADAPEFTVEEMEIIGTPCDFIGYNYYTGIPVRATKSNRIGLHGKEKLGVGYEFLEFSNDYARTDMTWPITPKALYYALKFSHEVVPNFPIYITENGMAAADKEELTGEVNDLSRVEYLRTHLETLLKVKQEGVNLKGYFVWSLMDNYEWSFGYTKRFGIVRVNYNTQERTPKMSAHYYSSIIKSQK